MRNKKKSVRQMLEIMQDLEIDGLSEKRMRQIETMKEIAQAILS